jgi:hypothetical protein
MVHGNVSVYFPFICSFSFSSRVKSLCHSFFNLFVFQIKHWKLQMAFLPEVPFAVTQWLLLSFSSKFLWFPPFIWRGLLLHFPKYEFLVKFLFYFYVITFLAFIETFYLTKWPIRMLVIFWYLTLMFMVDFWYILFIYFRNWFLVLVYRSNHRMMCRL